MANHGVDCQYKGIFPSMINKETFPEKSLRLVFLLTNTDMIEITHNDLPQAITLSITMLVNMN